MNIIVHPPRRSLLSRTRSALANLLLRLGGGLVRAANRLAGGPHIFGVVCLPCLKESVSETAQAAFQQGVSHGFHIARHPHRPVDRAMPEA